MHLFEHSIIIIIYLVIPIVGSGQVSETLPSLSDICNLRCPTLRFVPNNAKAAFARVLSATLRTVVSEYTVEAWTKLLMLPKCVLPSAKRRGRHNRPVPIDALCRMWSEGRLSDLWHRALQRSPTTSHSNRAEGDPGNKKIVSAISLAQDGLYGKACQALTSSGVAPNNDDTWKLLVSKHPHSPCPSVPPVSDVEFKLPSDQNLMSILMSFPKLTAAGPSGLRIQHLIDAAEVPLQTPLLQSLKAVINILSSGKAPKELAIYLAGGNLTALNKATLGDIRPIAVGEVLRRLVGKCLCAALRVKAASFFEPYQFGVACPRGAERIIHGLRACVEEHWLEEDFGVLKVDMKNAFNQVSRRALLSECAEHFPELLPWVGWCYGQHPYLWHTLGCLTSESGVQQGDPLGPLLFSLVLNVLVKTISEDKACSSNLFHAWYLDDGVLAGPRQSLCRCLSLLQVHGPALSLLVNVSKCEVFSHHNLDVFPSGMKASDKPNIVILGVAIGDLDFCSSFISTKRMEARALLSQLEQVGVLDPQVALVLLRLCGGFCKLVHLARSTPPSLSSQALSLFDNDIRRVFSECTGVDTSDTAWKQAQLSLSRGGLGLRSLSHHSSAAYISSICSSGFGSKSVHHLSQAVEVFNNLVFPVEAINVESVHV